MVTKRQAWLYYAPFEIHLPVISLGPVSSSFLLSRRRRLGQSGCLFSLDVNREPPGKKPKARVNKGKVTPNTQPACKRLARNRRVARIAVSLLRHDQKIGGPPMALPPRIRCGQIRSAVRSVFPDLTPVQELSVKTAQKLEKDPCDLCSQEAVDTVKSYKESRFTGPEVDEGHLVLFRRALAVNVPDRWDERRGPYIPNGHATQTFTRCEGGTWNEESFSETCSVQLIHSSGKPRIVTLYSGRNSELLSPLHDALYASLKRYGWLLVGSPTDEKVGGLNGAGPYVSVDYRNATDNILARYVQEAIQVLKEKSVRLTTDESRALDVVGRLLFEDSTSPAYRGQPMGSLMSFPLLCLINKTVVDLACLDLVEEGKMSWKEFRVHRCLINGDDLLYREISESHDILAGILRHGALVGLVVNEEKTMVSPDVAEINSMVFVKGRRQKKTNVSVVCWREEVTDPVGFLADSLVRTSSFRRFLRLWERPVRMAERKVQGPIPNQFFKVLVQDKFIRDALCYQPPPRPKAQNFFPVVVKPADYDLSREEEVRLISERVDRLRAQHLKPSKARGERVGPGRVRRIGRVLRERTPAAETTILKVLADGWEEKTKEKLRLEDEAARLCDPNDPAYCGDCYEGLHSKVACLSGMLRAFKQKRRVECQTPDAGSPADGVPSLVTDLDYIAFE